MQGQALAFYGITNNRSTEYGPKYTSATKMRGLARGEKSIRRQHSHETILPRVLMLRGDEVDLSLPLEGFDRHVLS